jgi:hypothetical protein
MNNNRNFDEIITKDSFLIFENKTAPYMRRKRLRPHVGHIIAVSVLLCGALLSPDNILAIISRIMIAGMVGVALIFLVHLPIRTLLTDRGTDSANGHQLGRSKKVEHDEHQRHSS